MKNSKYSPSFQWKDNVIYDHDVAIARFSHDPEAKRHICMDGVRLTPGGEPLISSWILSWRHGSICQTSKLESINVRHSGGDKLSIEFTATTPDNGFTSNARIDLSFDQQRQCYRYETLSSLQVNTFPFYSWKEIDSAKYSEYVANFPEEFANFLPGSSYAYWAPVDPTPKKWQAFVYQNTAGGWSWVPQHHLHTPDKYNICFPAGRCKLGFVDDPCGNPCIELIERVPATSSGAICWAMNDVHMLVDKVALSDRFRVKYALYLFTPEETAEILAKAKGYIYTKEEQEAYNRPCFALVGKCNYTCDFEAGYDFEKMDDNFRFWLPMGEIQYTSWVRGEGRGGGRCLKQDTPVPARVLWQVESTNAPVVCAGKRYRVSAWIKTQTLKGEACLEAWSYDCKSPHNAPPLAPGRSQVLSNTTDWQEVAVDVDVDVVHRLHFSDDVRGKLFVGKIAIRLVHEGQGASWFDDVTIREVGITE